MTKMCLFMVACLAEQAVSEQHSGTY